MFTNLTAAPAHHRAQAERVAYPALLSFTPLGGSVSDFVARHRTHVAGVRTQVGPALHMLPFWDRDART